MSDFHVSFSLEGRVVAVTGAAQGIGQGVAVAAAQAGVPFVELRTVSNPIGPRDRDAWRMREALAALTTAAAPLP